MCDDVVRSGWLSAATRLLDVRRSEKGSLHAPSRHARPTRFRLACAHKRLLRARRCEDAAEEQNGELQCSLSSKVKTPAGSFKPRSLFCVCLSLTARPPPPHRPWLSLSLRPRRRRGQHRMAQLPGLCCWGGRRVRRAQRERAPAETRAARRSLNTTGVRATLESKILECKSG